MQKSYFSVGVFLLMGMLLTSVSLFAQNRKITGIVTSSEDGSPIPGVGIIVKNTTQGTATDFDGKYALNAPDNATLVFSFLGFTTEEIVVGTQTTINVTLVPDFKKLAEVVVVGYGTQKKTDVTGSVATISSESFNKGQVTSPDQLIVGKVAGVQITSNGGAPGAGSQIRIRGGASLSGSNDPLIVIDGVPVDNTETKGSANALSMINPNDIESFSILKDASATAIYGSRASNGVIIITTKKGKAGDKLNITFSTLGSFSQITKQIDVLSADEFRAYVNKNGTETQKKLLGNASTDWQKQIFKDAYGIDNNLTVSGSVKALPYRVSVGYFKQNGILKTSSLERTSAALNLSPRLLQDNLKIDVNVKGIISNSRFADEGAIGSALAFDPTQPVYGAESKFSKFGGYFEWTDTLGNILTNAPRNPLSLLEQRTNKAEVKRSIGNIQLDYRLPFFPALRANLNLGYDVSETNGRDFRPLTAGATYNNGGSVVNYSQNKTNKLLDFYLNYVKEIPGIKSKVDATAGYSYQSFLSKNPAANTYNIAGELKGTAIPFVLPLELRSFFGRINYSFANRLLFTATVRNDNSSRFSKEKRSGIFPAVSLAWRLSEESFLKNTGLFSDLKVRVGYGITGQQDIGDPNRSTSYYPYLPIYAYSDSSSMYQFGNTFYRTLRPSGYDVNIKWEETATTNVGLDFGFLKGRLTGTLDYYVKKTSDLLAFIPVPAGANLSNSIYTNVGNMQTKGVEAALNFDVISREKLTWNVGINATYNKREITNLSKTSNDNSVGLFVGGITGGTGNTVQVNTVGYTPNSFYVYKQVYDESGKPLEGVYADLNNDGVISEKDKYRYQSPAPKYTLGFNTRVTYEKWSLGTVLRANLGNYMYNNIASNNGTVRNINNSGYSNNLSGSIRETNFGNTDSEWLFSDYYVENASFLRMDNLNLGYNIGSVFKDRLFLQVSANVQNVFVVTKYTGLDPETQFTNANTGGGIDNNFYPRPRIYSLGLTVNFK